MADTNDTNVGPDGQPLPEGDPAAPQGEPQPSAGAKPDPIAEAALKAAKDALSGMGDLTAPQGQSPAAPGEEAEPDSMAQAALNAARDAIAGLGDLAASATETAPTSGGGDMDDPFARAMAEAVEQEKAEKAAAAANASPFEMPSFAPNMTPAQQRAMDMLSDVNLQVKIELGRTRMLVEDVLRLGEGAVVELDKLAGDPVDVYVNDRHVAKGEVLVLNDNFCVRINEIVAPPGENDKKSQGAA
jgi:flagellar motor switch protein FliN